MNQSFKFEEKGWWKKSSQIIKEELFKESVNNSKLVDFLENVSENRGYELIEIKKCEVVGSFIYFCFENRIQITNQIVEKELIFLRNQKNSEGKCLLSTIIGDKKLIISDQGKAITTFFPNFGKDKLCNFPKKIEGELNKIFGQGWGIEKIVDLGAISPFNEICPENIPIFWVELKVEKEIKENSLDIKEYNELSELFNKFDDAIALSIIGRKLKY